MPTFGARNFIRRVEISVDAAPIVGSVFGRIWLTVVPLAPYCTRRYVVTSIRPSYMAAPSE
jgi:hypothetical protein